MVDPAMMAPPAFHYDLESPPELGLDNPDNQTSTSEDALHGVFVLSCLAMVMVLRYWPCLVLSFVIVLVFL